VLIYLGGRGVEKTMKRLSGKKEGNQSIRLGINKLCREKERKNIREMFYSKYN
jgi:hypothetical protein